MNYTDPDYDYADPDLDDALGYETYIAPPSDLNYEKAYEHLYLYTISKCHPQLSDFSFQTGIGIKEGLTDYLERYVKYILPRKYLEYINDYPRSLGDIVTLIRTVIDDARREEVEMQIDIDSVCIGEEAFPSNLQGK